MELEAGGAELETGGVEQGEAGGGAERSREKPAVGRSSRPTEWSMEKPAGRSSRPTGRRREAAVGARRRGGEQAGDRDGK